MLCKISRKPVNIVLFKRVKFENRQHRRGGTYLQVVEEMDLMGSGTGLHSPLKYTEKNIEVWF